VLTRGKMAQSSVKKFCKTSACPSSQMLLRYRRCQLAIKDLDAIEIHLRNCEFCGAELQLLTRHRIDMSSDRLVEMPAQLRSFAEDLFGQISRFTLTDLTTDNRLSG